MVDEYEDLKDEINKNIDYQWDEICKAENAENIQRLVEVIVRELKRRASTEISGQPHAKGGSVRSCGHIHTHRTQRRESPGKEGGLREILIDHTKVRYKGDTLGQYSVALRRIGNANLCLEAGRGRYRPPVDTIGLE